MTSGSVKTWPLRRLAFAALAAGLIALAPGTAARADDSAHPVSMRADAPEIDRAKPARMSREYLIKAAILFNFAKFATWPDSAFRDEAAPVRICVLGDDPFGSALDSLHGKKVGVRPLALSRIADVQDAPRCHVLFVSASEEGRLAEILDHLAQRPVLTVADMDRFASAGGIIGLKKKDDRSRIEINIDAADKAGLRLSSKLLRLAETVSTQTAQGGAGVDAP